MSENKEKEKVEVGEKKAPVKAKKAAGGPEAFGAPKKVKIAWTLEKCMKAARRFKSENEWSAGAPAAYKSAQSHGWVKQCVAAMTGAKVTNTKTGFRKSA